MSELDTSNLSHLRYMEIYDTNVGCKKAYVRKIVLPPGKLVHNPLRLRLGLRADLHQKLSAMEPYCASYCIELSLFSHVNSKRVKKDWLWPRCLQLKFDLHVKSLSLL